MQNFKQFFYVCGLIWICVVFVFSSCTIKREISGENDNEVNEILEIITPLYQLQKLTEGLEWIEFYKSIEQNVTVNTSESDDSFPGSTPTDNETLGACYVDNTGTVTGFDLCCYNLKQSNCYDVAGIFTSGYDITFSAGSNDASACTGQGFTQAYNSSSFSCYLK